MLVVEEGNGLSAIHQILVDGILGLLGDKLEGGVAHRRHAGLGGLWSVDLDGVDNEKEVEVREWVVGVAWLHGADVEGDVHDFKFAGQMAVDHGGWAPRGPHHSGRASQRHLGALQQSNFTHGFASNRADGPRKLILQLFLQFRIEEGDPFDFFQAAD